MIYQVEDVTCQIGQASASRAGAVLALTITRGGNPLALCVGGTQSYRYVARVEPLAAGRYEVHVIDERLPYPAREVGVAVVTVNP